MPYTRKRGAQSANANKDPYAKNQFKGTPEIQAIRERILQKPNALIKNGKKVYISDIVR